MYRHFKRIVYHDYISEWKSKGLSDESIKPPSALNNIVDPSVDYLGTKTRVKLSGSCSKQDKITFGHKTKVNVYNVCNINNFPISSYPTLENCCLFGAVSLTKNINDIGEYKYFGYGIGFDRKGALSIGNAFGRNCIILAVNMSSSVHVDKKKKGIIQSTLQKIIRSFI